MAFSRDQPQKRSEREGREGERERERGEGGRGRRGSNILTRYVQHLIKEHAEEVWDIVGAGEGYFYISGIPSFCLRSTPHSSYYPTILLSYYPTILLSPPSLSILYFSHHLSYLND